MKPLWLTCHSAAWSRQNTKSPLKMILRHFPPQTLSGVWFSILTALLMWKILKYLVRVFFWRAGMKKAFWVGNAVEKEFSDVQLPTCVQPNPYPEGNVWHVPHFECSHRAEYVQGHVGYFSCMLVSIPFWEPWGDHVGITNCLHLANNITLRNKARNCKKWKETQNKITSHLVNIMVSKNSIKQRVKVIQKVNHFNGFTEGWNGCETHNVIEVDGHLVKILRFHSATSLEGFCHWTETPTQKRWQGANLFLVHAQELRHLVFCVQIFHYMAVTSND